MATRPKRHTRATAKAETATTSSPNGKAKAKAAPKPYAEPNLSFLLQNSKSSLTRIDISNLFSIETWTLLPDEARETLATFLPPTAFHGFQRHVDSTHPSHHNDEPMTWSQSGINQLDTSVFKDAHFISASHTFQDHIYSGWRTEMHETKLVKYLAGIRDGSLAAPWKDEVWEKENEPLRPQQPHPQPTSTKNGKSSGAVATTTQIAPAPTISGPERAGEAANVSLTDMVAAGVLKVGDVLAYKRNFAALSQTIEKDVVIESLHPTNKSITVLLPSSITKDLPSVLLSKMPGASDNGSIRSTTFNTPSMLENAILDIDGRVEKAKRPNGNAWKNLTVWRWRDEGDGDGEGARQGRESHGTLFYIRGCFYHDR